jgi:hypothetical protein
MSAAASADAEALFSHVPIQYHLGLSGKTLPPSLPPSLPPFRAHIRGDNVPTAPSLPPSLPPSIPSPHKRGRDTRQLCPPPS